MFGSNQQVPAWRLNRGKIPLDVFVCAYMAGLTALALILSIVFAYAFPEPNSRKGIIQVAWDSAFWTYLGCCIYFADMAIDRQARNEANQQRQSKSVEYHDNETGDYLEDGKPMKLNGEFERPPKISESQSTGVIAPRVQIQQQKGMSIQAFNAAVLSSINPRGYSSEQLVKRAAIVCALMIEGLLLSPVILYLGQRLFLPEGEVEEMATNIPSWSLLFWSLLLLSVSKYGSIHERRERGVGQRVADNRVQQDARERIVDECDGVGPCDRAVGP